jgi:hypothetical protein
VKIPSLAADQLLHTKKKIIDQAVMNKSHCNSLIQAEIIELNSLDIACSSSH